jgi:hypothetical protein
MNSGEEKLALPPVQDALEAKGFVLPSAQDALEVIGGLPSAPPPTELIGGTTAPERPAAKKTAQQAVPQPQLELPEDEFVPPRWLRVWRWIVGKLGF